MSLPSKLLRTAVGEDERKALASSFREALVYRRRLKEIFESRKEGLRSKQDNDDYSSPAWSERQAALNAGVKEINEILSLLGDCDAEEKE